METTKILNIIPKITGAYVHVIDQHYCDMTKINEHIVGARFDQVVFENVTFDSVNFQSTEFLSTNFIDCVFKNCNFSFTKFKDCNLIACKIENCTFCITNSLNCNFLSCTYIKNSWETSKTIGAFLNCNIDETQRSNMDITLTHEFPDFSSEQELYIA